MKAERLDISHIERPNLPWRTPDQALTECGLVATSYPTISRQALVDRLKEWGEQRTCMTVCMSCFDTVKRWRTWEEDPIDGVQRAAAKEPHFYVPFTRLGALSNPVAPNTPLRTELRAIAILIERHREEFDGIVTGLGEVVNLGEERRKRLAEKREARKANKKPWDFS